MFEGGRNDIEKAINLLKTINQNMKVDHMMKDMWDGATEEETREYIEDFGLINLAISALEKQMSIKGIPYDSSKNHNFVECGACHKDMGMYYNYCHVCGQKMDWRVEK